MSGIMAPTLISIDELHLDHANPRLVEYEISPQTSEDELLVILWEATDVLELAQSIVASGFFPHEALIVANENGKKIVIEGNRRLAAVRVLLSKSLAAKHGWQVPKISAEARKKLEKLPVIITTRKDSWRSFSFKHINGSAKWGGFAKAAYIAQVHRTYGIPLSQIANQLGDRFRTTQRLYRGLMVLEQAERNKVYDREDRFYTRFAFSYLYTGLDLSGVSSFLRLSLEKPEDQNPVPKTKLRELGELLAWLYGSKKLKRAPVIRSLNPDLSDLNTILGSKDGIAALRAGVDIEKALEISRSPIAVFEEALLAAKRELTTARAYLTIGYDQSEALLRTAGTVTNLAEDMYLELERKRYPSQKKIRLSER